MKKSKVLLVMLSISALYTWSCSQSNSSRGTTATFSWIYSNIINVGGSSTVGCVTCHQPGHQGPAQGVTEIDFTSQSAAYNSLFNKVNSNSQKATCGSVQLVVGGALDQSYLVGAFDPNYRNKSNFAGVAGCTPIDHSQTAVMSNDDLGVIETWITNNAVNN